MRAFHCTWTLVLLLALPATAQQQPQRQQPQQAQPQAQAVGSQNTLGYTVFLRGTPVGHQDVSVRSDAQGLTISGQGQIADPIDILTRRAEVRYRPDLSPESLVIDARIGGVDITLQTTFSNGTAVSQGMQGSDPIATTDMVSPQSVVLPNVFLGAHAALARRLAGAAPGAEFHAFVGPGPGRRSRSVFAARRPSRCRRGRRPSTSITTSSCSTTPAPRWPSSCTPTTSARS